MLSSGQFKNIVPGFVLTRTRQKKKKIKSQYKAIKNNNTTTRQSKQQIICLFWLTGWEDCQVFSLPVGQAVSSMNKPKNHFNKIQKIFLMSRIDYSSSVIIYLNFPKHFTFLSRKAKSTNLAQLFEGRLALNPGLN